MCLIHLSQVLLLHVTLVHVIVLQIHIVVYVIQLMAVWHVNQDYPCVNYQDTFGDECSSCDSDGCVECGPDYDLAHGIVL